jgi:hypothetical protein
MRDEIIKMAREAQQESFVGDTGHWFKMEAKDLERFFHMAQAAVIEQGYRKCAEGQKTTQFCGMLEQAVLAEREACAKVAQSFDPHMRWSNYGQVIANKIRDRGLA